MGLVSLSWDGVEFRILDQRELPLHEIWFTLSTAEQAAEAIRTMAVRGAPAIGITAAFGVALGLKQGLPLGEIAKLLKGARPTAVNLAWAVDRVCAVPHLTTDRAFEEARAILQEDLNLNLAIGRNGLDLVPSNARILTICNTGSLATAGHGTALGIIRSAHEAGKNIFVWSCETRPRLQGLKLTAFELQYEKIPFASIADGAAASLMAAGKVDLVIAGADRICANGDTANKLGTYSLAVLAMHHGIPFYIAAPFSTLDSDTPDGSLIPIEERAAQEITEMNGIRIAPEGCPVFNPAFDVTPGELITAIVTDQGVMRPIYAF